MQNKLRLSTALFALLLPVTALATPPENVTNISAESTPNGVVIRWDKVDGDIASYRVFYSHESILDNNAVFDDSSDTNGSVTELTLPRMPDVTDVYATVLAVNTDGEESPLFEEEAHVHIGDSVAQAPTVPSTPTTTTVSFSPSTNVLRALKVESVSATGVLLTFNAPVVLDAQTIKTAFSIKDGNNGTLAIYRIVANGTGVLLDTLPQERQRTYQVHIDTAVRGRTVEGENGGSVLTLDPEQTDMLFVGSVNGVPPSQSPTIVGTGAGADVQNLQVQTAYEGANRYTIQVSWAAVQGTIAGYRISQSVDGGQSFGSVQNLQNNVSSVRIPGVQSGELGILVQTIGMDQSLSRGVFQRIILPSESGVTGSVTPPRSTPPRNTHLPQTGVGTAALLAIAGGCAGVQAQRRKQKKA